MSHDPSTNEWQPQTDGREQTVAERPATGYSETPAYSETSPRDADYAPDSTPVDVGPTFARRVDGVGALLLILAGAAAAGAMLLPWVADLSGATDTGFELVQGRHWDAVAVLSGGGLVLLMGLALLIPMRHHRAVGFLALIGALAVTAAVVRLILKDAFTLDLVGLGFAAAAECAALGLLGAFKALLTPGRKIS